MSAKNSMNIGLMTSSKIPYRLGPMSQWESCSISGSPSQARILCHSGVVTIDGRTHPSLHGMTG